MTIPRYAKKNLVGVWGNFVFDLSPGQKALCRTLANDKRPTACLVPLGHCLEPAIYEEDLHKIITDS